MYRYLSHLLRKDAPGYWGQTVLDIDKVKSVSSGDSSGALFVLDDDEVWKLGGILTNVGDYIFPSPDGSYISGAYFNSKCSPWDWGGSTSGSLAIAPRFTWIWEITGAQ